MKKDKQIGIGTRIGVREAMRRYEALGEKVEITPLTHTYYCYTCKNIEKAIQNVKGKVSKMIRCSKCSGEMVIGLNAPAKEVTLLFYRPSITDFVKNRGKVHFARHILAGGLIVKELEKEQ